MSINPAEEESETLQEMGRIARGLGMAGMQISEASARKQDRTTRADQSLEAERQRQAQDVRKAGADQARALLREAYSAQFWRSVSNAHLASSIVDAQQLAVEGHGTANSAYMAFADRVRDLHGLNIEGVAVGGTREERFNALQAALDDHNAAGRLREEAEVNDHAAESIREEQQAQAEDQYERDVEDQSEYDEALRAAATGEAAEAGLDTDDYLDRLAPEDHESILHDPENAEARDSRIETASSEDPVRADRTHSESHPEERHFDTAADVARDDAARLENLPQSQHGKDMRRHLDNAARLDPQSAAARRSAVTNLPGEGKNYVKNSLESKAHVRKNTGPLTASRAPEKVQER